MVGGRVIEIRRMREAPPGSAALEPSPEPIADGCVVRIWVADSSGDELCVYATAASVMPAIGEAVWWQGKRIFFARDTLCLKKLGYSFRPPKGDDNAPPQSPAASAR